MRPKFLALLAVSAIALVGCSSTEPTVEPTQTPVKATQAPSSPSPKAVKKVNPNAQVEQQFADFAELRAGVHAQGKSPDRKATIKALHAFCEDGKPFKVSKVQPLNENLEVIAEDTYCEKLK